jgi:hypothetical protein
MEHLEQYSEQAIHWQKSVSEISKFIIDRLDKEDFCEYLSGENIDEARAKHWHERLEELYDKATSRVGYRIDRDKLMKDAKENILKLRDSGELPSSKVLDRFCSHIEEH